MQAMVIDAELDSGKTPESFQIDDLHFVVQRSAKRRSMQITVERTGELFVTAPPQVSIEQLTAFATEKRIWVYTKLAEKERLQRPVTQKQYVAGEGFLYLGRTYRLKLADNQDIPLKLMHGRFFLDKNLTDVAREHFIRWYSEKAKAWLMMRVADYQARLEIKPSGVKVQDLGYRWGSCGKGNWLYFNWKTILLPARIAEYVVVHEIAHLKEPHHTPAFWLLVERLMPDYVQRKVWLAEHGIDVEGI